MGGWCKKYCETKSEAVEGYVWNVSSLLINYSLSSTDWQRTPEGGSHLKPGILPSISVWMYVILMVAFFNVLNKLQT